MAEEERSALRHRYQMYQHRQGLDGHAFQRPSPYHYVSEHDYDDFYDYDDYDDYRAAAFDEIVDRNAELPASSPFFGSLRNEQYHVHDEWEDDTAPFHATSTTHYAGPTAPLLPSSGPSVHRVQQQEQPEVHDYAGVASEVDHDQQSPEDEDEVGGEEVCRVCRCESTSDQPLFYPCLCKGSIRYVHQECLTLWLKHSNKTSCELCKHPFRFQPVYAENAPKILAGHELLLGVVKKAARSFKSVFRTLLTCFGWFVAIPVGTSWIWRYYFSREFHFATSHNDCIWGAFLSVCIFILFLGITWLVEYLHMMPEVGLLGDEHHHHPVAAGHDAVDQPEGAAGAEAEHPQDEAGANVGDVQGGPEELLDLHDGDDDVIEIDFEDLVGLRGPITKLFMMLGLVLAFNAAVLAVLALLPYWIGHTTLQFRQLLTDTDAIVDIPVDAEQPAQLAEQEFYSNLKAVVVGYIILTSSALAWLACFAVTHDFTQARPITKDIASALRFALLFVRVGVMMFVELAVCPEVFGWFIDVSSLPLFDATMASRLAFWRAHPHVSTFMHWVVGMVFMYLLSSSVRWLRSVLRKDVLWFLRTQDDDDWDVIQEVIQVPLLRQTRRIIVSIALFGLIIVLLVGAPIQAAMVLPWMKSFTLFDSLNTGTSSDLVVFHILVPLVFKYARPKDTIKALALWWLQAAGGRLHLMSYLFPSVDEHNQPMPVQYPPFFGLRITALVVASWLLLFATNLLLLVAPLTVGRLLFAALGLAGLSDFYAVIAGATLLWAGYRGVLYMIEHISQQNASEAIAKLKGFALIGAKCGFVGFFGLVVIPLLVGLLFDAAVTLPVRVPWLDQCPAPNPLFQSWALGLFYLKIWHKLLMRAEHSDWKQRFQRITQDGYANVNVVRTWNEVLWPMSMILVLINFVPYFIAVRLVPLVSDSVVVHAFCERFCYLIAMTVWLAYESLWMLCDWAVKLHNSVRDEKYLIGRNLQNYTEQAQPAL